MIKMPDIREWFSTPIQSMKTGIWAYFLLLIFEGALRKWFLPGLATPLLIIRDPIALWTMYQAYRYRMFPSSFYIQVMSFITLVGLLTTMSFGHGSLPVALFGARILWIHFPFMFVIAKVFTREDVLKMMKVTLWIAVPMAVLIALQFYSPQSAWVNRGVGGNMEGAGFSGSGEYYRPPGTFSFTTGNVQFFSMVAAFLFYFLINNEKIKKSLLYLSAGAMILSIPLSISRSLLFNTLIVAMFTVMAIGGNLKLMKKIFSIAGIFIVAVAILSQTTVFKTSFGAFSTRFTSANEEEGGAKSVFLDRYLGGMIKALEVSGQQSFFGLGMGMGSNVGSQLLAGSGKGFLIAEDEWGRLVGEMGPLLGLLIIFIRLNFAFSLLRKSYNKMKQGDMLSWILLSFGLMAIVNGQWAQPTALGFVVVITGLIMASLNDSEETAEEVSHA